jgi:hypothetical protein
MLWVRQLQTATSADSTFAIPRTLPCEARSALFACMACGLTNTARVDAFREDNARVVDDARRGGPRPWPHRKDSHLAGTKDVLEVVTSSLEQDATRAQKRNSSSRRRPIFGG